MVTPVDVSYTGPKPISGGRAAAGAVPAYIAAAALMTATLVPNSANGPGGLNSYSGFVIAEGKIINPGFSGHTDNDGDNGVYALDYTKNTPTGWDTLRAATPFGQRTIQSDYYADGLPSAPHGYHSGIFIPSLRQIWRFGQRFTYVPQGSGSPSSFAHIHIFDLAVKDWVATANLPPDMPAHNGGAVLNNAGIVYSGNLGFKTNPALGRLATTTARPNLGNGVGSRYPQANNADDDYILNFVFGDGGESGTYTPVYASYLVGDTLTALTVNPSAAYTQLQSENPFGPALTWCKPLNKWLFYHGGKNGGSPNTVYGLSVDRTNNTVDVSTITIAGPTMPVSGSGVMSKFQYIDAVKTLFMCTDITVGVYFVRIA